MMPSFKRVAYLCLLVAQFGCLLNNNINYASAFVAPDARVSTRSNRVGQGSGSSSTELGAIIGSRRREVFGNLKKAVFAGGLVGAFRRDAALAEESPSPVTGRVVEFVIGNVGGEPGATGTVKIQLVSLNASFLLTMMILVVPET